MAYHENLHEHFEDHFSSTYADEGGDYDTMEPYYAFGYDLALDAEDEIRPYDEAKADIRSEFERRHPDTDYDFVEQAVRFAYEKVRLSRR